MRTIFFCFSILIFQLKAQESLSKKYDLFADLGIGLGSSKVSFTSAFNYNYQLGKKKKIVVGTGIRYTWFGGKNINFTSAPNDLAIDKQSIDTLLAPNPNVHSLNLLINLGYNISQRV